MSKRTTYILSFLIVIAGPLGVAFCKSSLFFDVFYSIKVPRPGKMIAGLHSFQTQEEVLNFLNWQNIEWEVVAEKKVRRSFIHVGHIDKTIRALHFPFDRFKGTLNFSLNNDRIFRSSFTPADADVEAVRALVSQSVSAPLLRNSPVPFDKNVTVEWQTNEKGEASLVWVDARLLREILRQN